MFGKLTLGNPVSLCSVKDRTSVKGFSTDVSSLSWMGATASDVINSRIDGVVGSFFWNLV